MKNWMIILLAWSIGANVFLHATMTSWKSKFQKLEQVAQEEYRYAKEASEKKYILSPEHGLKFYSDFKNKKEVTSFEVFITHTGGHDVQNPEMSCFFGSGLVVNGVIDASDFSYYHRALYNQQEMPIPQKILLLFCLQIIEQGNFFYGDLSQCGDKAAVAYLLHPAGVLTLVVAEHGENRYFVAAVREVHDRVSRGCWAGGFFKLPRSNFSYFKPSDIKLPLEDQVADKKTQKEPLHGPAGN